MKRKVRKIKENGKTRKMGNKRGSKLKCCVYHLYSKRENGKGLKE